MVLTSRSTTLPPPGGAVASVSIIDSTSRIGGIKAEFLLVPEIRGFEYMPTLPTWSFLIESSSASKKVLFDLGIPKDFDRMSPAIRTHLARFGWHVEAPKNVSEILEENGVETSEIDSIIWSHHHWDHIGDPSQFPSSTELVIGPGFKEAIFPGYPAKEDSLLRESDYAARTVTEIDFNTHPRKLTIGPFPAVDFFGDGSFYLLDTPGHSIGHLAGLARTSSQPDTFIFMGGDLCHHGGELRPSAILPYPREITPHPWHDHGETTRRAQICPGALFEKLQLDHGRPLEEPLFDPSSALSIPEAIRTIRNTQLFDGDENVFFVSAHDDTLMGVIDLFPQSANAWKVKGWRERTLWAFLRDLKGCVERP